MGWYSTCGANKKVIIKQCVSEATWENKERGIKHEVITHCLRGNCLWALMKRTVNGESTIYVCLYLLGKCDQDWGYKPMDMYCHPHYYSCPISYVEQCNDYKNSEYACNWVQGVKEYHLKQAIRKAKYEEARKVFRPIFS